MTKINECEAYVDHDKWIDLTKEISVKIVVSRNKEDETFVATACFNHRDMGDDEPLIEFPLTRAQYEEAIS